MMITTASMVQNGSIKRWIDDSSIIDAAKEFDFFAGGQRRIFFKGGVASLWSKT